jgi:DNA-binding CsgD family transcriptional regulator
VVVPSLVRWGVSADSDLVYRTLASFGPRTIPGAARELGMSVRRVGDAVEELATEQAVIPLGNGRRSQQPSESTLWRAQPPDEVVRTLRRRRLNLVDPWEQARRHVATVVGFELAPSVDALANRQIKIVQGVDRIQRRIAELGRIERHEHLTFSPEQAIDASTVEAASPLDRDLLTRGVRVHVLGVPPADGDATAAHTENLYKLGARLRVAERLPVKLMVFDRKVALLPVDPLDARRGALEIAEPSLVDRFVALFLREWDHARDPRRHGVPSVLLTDRERALVEQLAAGHTDAVVGRRLSISARTIGYTLRGLMDRLGVENRFQLGLALGAQGVASGAVSIEAAPESTAASAAAVAALPPGAGLNRTEPPPTEPDDA